MQVSRREKILEGQDEASQAESEEQGEKIKDHSSKEGTGVNKVGHAHKEEISRNLQ